MDYTELATELLHNMPLLRKAMSHIKIAESMQGEIFMLRCIADRGGGVIPSEISNEMDVSSARVAAALNSLENKGLITRRIDPIDRRRILVSLTPEGEVTAENHKLAVVRDTAEMLSRLGEHDASEYVRITGRLAEITLKHNIM